MKARNQCLWLAVGALVVLAIGARAVEREVIERQKAAAAEGMNAFGLDLYGVLAKQEGNLFLSPYSIHTVLTMTWAGARGQTAEQMARILHLPEKTAWLHAALHRLTREVEQAGGRREPMLRVANALWGQKGEPFLESFLDLLSRRYGGALREVDFVGETERARRTINEWASDRTEGKIEDLVPRDIITKGTRLVLANAIYFKGLWESPFDEDDTRKSPFYVSAEEVVEVPMMYQEEEFAYAEGEGYRALELPYKGGELAMVVLLPNQRGGLGALESELDGQEVFSTLGRMQQREVHVYLPRFRLESALGLEEVLSSMGMTDAFSPGKADFSGINGRRNLSISAVLHKAFVKVDEEGTEAAAATGGMVGAASLAPRPVVFRADHPFIFLIRHRPTGLVLFAGRLADPGA